MTANTQAGTIGPQTVTPVNWTSNVTFTSVNSAPPIPQPLQPSQIPPEWSNAMSAMVAAQKVAKEQIQKDDSPKEKHYNIPIIKFFASRLRGKEQEGEIGIEIECEGINLFQTPVSYWQTHPDNSLRAVGEHPPIEYVLRKPLIRNEVPKALDYLSRKLKAAGSTIQDSTRTSVHIHINVQKLTIKEIYQIVCLYIIFEELLIEFSGPDRVGNLFCLSAKQAEYFITVLESAIQNEDYRELFSQDLRYTSCNTASIGRFGSLEFRSMRGTVDQGLIQLWIDILLLIRDKALEFDNPRDIVEAFHRSRPEAFFEMIFGSRYDIVNLFRHKPNLNTSMWDGLRLMRDAAYAIKWEAAIPKELKKKEHEYQEKEPLNQPENPNPHPGPISDTIDHNGMITTRNFRGVPFFSQDERYCIIAANPNDWTSGSYWVVNMTPIALNYVSSHTGQTIPILGFNKALFRSNHRYDGPTVLTDSERIIIVQSHNIMPHWI